MGVATKSTFGSKPSGGSCREKHYHKPWFDTDYCTTKRELRLWLKANPDSHAVIHQESKLKKFIKKEKIFLRNYKSSTYVCAYQGGCVFVLEKISAKGTHCEQDQCSYIFGRLLRASWPVSCTHMTTN